MPYYTDSQEWLHQSGLLLEARPTTTRITTKYRISPPPPPRKSRVAAQSDPTTTKSSSQQQSAQSRAFLVLKTYDPVSGVCLKYKTDKAAEVGRLVAALGKCGRAMAGLPPKDEGVIEGVDTDGKPEVKKDPEMKPAVSAKDAAKSGSQPEAQMQKRGEGGGKKKKGKR